MSTLLWLISRALPHKDISVPRWAVRKHTFERAILDSVPAAGLVLRNGEPFLTGVTMRHDVAPSGSEVIDLAERRRGRKA